MSKVYVFLAEGYKKRLYAKYCDKLATISEDMIGTGEIAQIIKKVFLDKDNNLINQQYSRVTYIAKLDENKNESEKILYDVFRGSDDEYSFNEIIEYFGARYELLGLLFFLKDREKYLPIRPEKFRRALSLLEVDETCTKGCTWEHYIDFINAIEEVQEVLMDELDIPVELIDAHSFVWWLPRIAGAEDFPLDDQYQNARLFLKPLGKYRLSEKQQEADFKYFRDKYSWQALDNLSDKELAYRLFAWRDGSLVYDVMVAERFGKHGHAGQQPSNWLPAKFDPKIKKWFKRGGSDMVITEDEAIGIAKGFAEEFILIQKEIESYEDFGTIADYRNLEDFLKKNNKSESLHIRRI